MNDRSNGSHLTAIVLTLALVAGGCATTAGGRLAPVQDTAADPAVMAEYVQTLALGTTVRVDRANGRTVRGTLMKTTPELLIVQPKTRLPVPPVEIRLAEVLRVTPDTNGGGSSLGKAIAVGAATGAAAALGVIAILAAIFND